MNFFTKMTVAVLPLALLAACASTPEEQTTSADTGAAATTAPAAGAESMGAGNAGASQMNPLDDPNSLLSKRVIYFDFDKADIKPEYRDIVQAHAAYLAQNSGTKVTLEGNTDERGTREYNMGLGERRGNAVSSALQANGGNASQVNVVSYGEERPTCTEKAEPCWSKNRRSHFLVKQ
jgi:peptidoglycan-associated lipoprotein